MIHSKQLLYCPVNLNTWLIQTKSVIAFALTLQYVYHKQPYIISICLFVHYPHPFSAPKFWRENLFLVYNPHQLLTRSGG